MEKSKSTKGGFLGDFFCENSQKLHLFLVKTVKGIGVNNVFLVLKQLLKDEKTDYRKVVFGDLTLDQKKALNELIERNQIEIENSKDFYLSNKKNRNISKEYSEELQKESFGLILRDLVIAYEKTDIKRLSRMNCYVGRRHDKKMKVHGQRTRSTGRKNKIMKGFQKNKQKKKNLVEEDSKKPKDVKLKKGNKESKK